MKGMMTAGQFEAGLARLMQARDTPDHAATRALQRYAASISKRNLLYLIQEREEIRRKIKVACPG